MSHLRLAVPGPGHTPARRLAARLTLAAAALAGASTAASSATIYQCAPGHYSERPCSGGTTYQPSQPVRQPSAEERNAAAEVAQREKRLAHELQADRQQMEREAARRGAIGLSPDLPPTAAGRKGKHEKKDKKEKRDRRDAQQRKSPAGKLGKDGGLRRQDT